MAISKYDARAHVIFDNDGTLVNSEGNFIETIGSVLPKYLGREVTQEEVSKNYIPDWVEFIKNFGIKGPDRTLINSIISDLMEINKDYMPALYPGIRKLIIELHKNNIATYIWTGRETESALAIFDFHNIRNCFTDMMFMDNCIPKPHPDGPIKMLGDIDKSKIVHIGDSIVDIHGADAFEIPCLIVDWDLNISQEKFLELGAQQIIKNTSEVLTWVSKNL